MLTFIDTKQTGRRREARGLSPGWNFGAKRNRAAGSARFQEEVTLEDPVFVPALVYTQHGKGLTAAARISVASVFF